MEVQFNMTNVVEFKFSNGDIFDPAKIEIVGGQAQLVLSGTYPTDNPTITSFNTIPVSVLKMSSLSLFKEGSDVEKPSGTDIKYVVKDGGVFRYHDGNDWALTDGMTYSESNTASEIDLNRLTLTITDGFQIVAFLNSDGSATPKL